MIPFYIYIKNDVAGEEGGMVVRWNEGEGVRWGGNLEFYLSYALPSNKRNKVSTITPDNVAQIK